MSVPLTDPTHKLYHRQAVIQEVDVKVPYSLLDGQQTAALIEQSLDYQADARDATGRCLKVVLKGCFLDQEREAVNHLSVENGATVDFVSHPNGSPTRPFELTGTLEASRYGMKLRKVCGRGRMDRYPGEEHVREVRYGLNRPLRIPNTQKGQGLVNVLQAVVDIEVDFREDVIYIDGGYVIRAQPLDHATWAFYGDKRGYIVTACLDGCHFRYDHVSLRPLLNHA